MYITSLCLLKRSKLNSYQFLLNYQPSCIMWELWFCGLVGVVGKNDLLVISGGQPRFQTTISLIVLFVYLWRSMQLFNQKELKSVLYLHNMICFFNSKCKGMFHFAALNDKNSRELVTCSEGKHRYCYT